jgi:hypothetical protein
LPCAVCGDGGARRAYCIPNDGTTHCIDQLPAGFFACPCAFPDASDCPLPEQVCHDTRDILDAGANNTTCRTCGEPSTVADQDKCKMGGTCTGLLSCN